MTKICEEQAVEVAEKDMDDFVQGRTLEMKDEYEQDHVRKFFEEKLLKEMKSVQTFFERHKLNPLEEIGFVRQDNLAAMGDYKEKWVRTDGDRILRYVCIRETGSIVSDLEPYQVPVLLKYLDQKAGKKEPGQTEIVLKLIEDELARANVTFPPFASEHEGWAVLYEEISEANEALSGANETLGRLWDLVRKHKGADKDLKEAMWVYVSEMKARTIHAIEEMIQVAAMCDKFNDSMNG